MDSIRILTVTYLSIQILVNVSGQEYLHLVRPIKDKYYEQTFVNGKISVTETRPDAISKYTKLVYSDNREGMWKVIQIPDWQRTYLYDGDATYLILDKDQSYSVSKDSSAILSFSAMLDNISGLLLTRERSKEIQEGNEKSQYTEEIMDLDEGHKKIVLKLGDQQDYYAKDYVFTMEVDTKKMELDRTYLTYTFLGDPISDEHILDTVYSNESEIAKVREEINLKLSAYRFDEYTVPEEEPEILVDFEKIKSQLSFVNFAPKESEYYLFDFYYVQCPPCLKAVPLLKEIHKSYPTETLSVIAINPYDSKAKIEGYIEKTNIPYASAMLDISFIQESGSNLSYPTFFLFDRDGNMLWQQSGFDENLVESVKEIIGR
jgi:thiol-disulfide isomerase/thioredoxin